MSDWKDFVNSFESPGNLPQTPGSIVEIAQGFATGGIVGGAARALQSGFETAFNLIGRGRREADIIVPIQNQVGGMLEAVNTDMRDPNVSIATLADDYRLVVEAYRQFDAFTREPRFTDGRASHQARNTIRPLVDGKDENGNIVRDDGGTLGNIERLIVAKGGYAPGNVANGGNPGDPSQLAPERAGGPDSGLLVAGAVAVGAKLLGWF